VKFSNTIDLHNTDLSIEKEGELLPIFDDLCEALEMSGSEYLGKLNICPKHLAILIREKGGLI